MSGYRDIWATLGVARTASVAEIRAAYAQQLKSFDVDADPQRFMALRQARDVALRMARQRAVAAAGDGPPAIPAIAAADMAADNAASGTLSFSPPPLPDAAAITAHLEDQPQGGTISVPIPAPSGNGYHGDAQRIGAPASGGGVPSPGIGGGTKLRPPVIETARQRGTIAIAMPDAMLAARIDQHYDAVRALLAPHYGRAEEERYLDSDEETALNGHIDALLADPRLEQIAFRTQAEEWFAETAANSVPRSDAIVERLVATFGWAADRGRIDQPRNVARVLARRDSLVFMRLVLEKKHPLNAAWRELARPADATSRRGFLVSRDDVQRLLKLVREHFPDLENCFDWYRVSLWEQTAARRGSGGAWRPGFFALILLIGVVRAVIGEVDHVPQPLATPIPIATNSMSADERAVADVLEAGRRKTTDAATDIDMALGRFADGSLSYDDVARANPRLRDDLQVAWKTAHRDDDTQSDFVARTGQDLIRRANVTLRRPPSYALAAELRRIELDRLRATRAQGAEACGALLSGGGPPVEIEQRFVDRRKRLMRDALLESSSSFDTDRKRTTFSIPGAVMQKVAARTSLPPKQLSAALNLQGPAGHICDARIALLEAALALPPRDGLKLLREM